MRNNTLCHLYNSPIMYNFAPDNTITNYHEDL